MGNTTADDNPYSSFQLTTLVALRMLIGWHFLYEGIAKLLNPYWTSAGYLQASQGPFADWFVGLAANPATLGVVDVLNKWGLVIIGAALVVGAGARLASLLGAVLLFLYFIANPPLLGHTDRGQLLVGQQSADRDGRSAGAVRIPHQPAGRPRSLEDLGAQS